MQYGNALAYGNYIYMALVGAANNLLYLSFNSASSSYSTTYLQSIFGT